MLGREQSKSWGLLSLKAKPHPKFLEISSVLALLSLSLPKLDLTSQA